MKKKHRNINIKGKLSEKEKWGVITDPNDLIAAGRDQALQEEFLKNLTIRNVRDRFMESKKAAGLSDSTIKRYHYGTGAVVRAFEDIGIHTMLEITPDSIRQHLTDLEETRNRGGVRNRYDLLHVFLKYFEKNFDFPFGFYDNPIDRVDYKAPPAKKLDGIDIADVKKMVSATYRQRNGLRDKAILLCLVSSGLRAQELLDLDIGDVDLETAKAEIHSGKGDKPRTVFFSREARHALKIYLRSREYKQKHDPLFSVYEREKRMGYAALNAMIKRVADRAGMATPPRLHDFRRTFAVSAVRAGVPLMVLQELLGHAKTETTRRYVKVTEGDLAREYRKIRFLD